MSSLCHAAQERISKLRLTDIFGDEVFRFRDGGTGRLWGFVSPDGVFHVLWWDPDHQVCPVD